MEFGFTGEATDASGLMYLRARYYVPGSGVFPSLDPVEGHPEFPLSLNRYGYVKGNVINVVDPSGLQGLEAICGGLALIDGPVPAGDAVCGFLLLMRLLGVMSFRLPGTDIPVRVHPGNPPVITVEPTPETPTFTRTPQPPTAPPEWRPPTPPEPLPPIPTQVVPTATPTALPLPTAQNPTVCPTETATPEREHIVRHYTSRRSYQQIKNAQWLVQTSDVGTRPPLDQGVFFTGPEPFNGGYNRRFIAAILGVDLIKTACYFDVRKHALEATGQGSWLERTTFSPTGRVEYIFLYRFSPLHGMISVLPALAKSGSTYILDGSSTDDLVEECD
ncbi:tRNA(Glu)-specific nuclease WapA [Anaerolineae bacterium]|nr:tRNA(Glu)-specific nuclease WapA [Anaerolineae bacterium]